jgi:hypothetical protein
LRVLTILFRVNTPSAYDYGDCGELAAAVARELGADLLHLAVLSYCKHTPDLRAVVPQARILDFNGS